MCMCINIVWKMELVALFCLLLDFTVRGMNSQLDFLLGKSLISAYVGLFFPSNLNFPKEEFLTFSLYV